MHSKTCPGRLMAATLILAMLLSMVPSGLVIEAVSPSIVISQVYGAGGNSGAVLKNDFVELYNRGATPVSLAGWSVQYASGGGSGNFSSNPVVVLTGTMQVGQYYLVVLAGGSTGAILPAADVTGTINMGAGAGKVALVNSTSGLGCNGGSTACTPAQLAQIVDLVGFGTANFYEGAAAPAPSATTSIVRTNGGCTDTDNNGADFVAAAPAPRNSASAAHYCSATTNPSGTGAANPPAVFPGEITTLNVVVTGGTNPPSTGLTVVADLTAIGGGAAQAFTLSGSNTFTFQATIPGGVSAGTKSLPVTIADSQGRSSIVAIGLIVGQAWVPIHDIQGDTHLSPKTGLYVSTRGIVTARRANGFYMQDPSPDANEATSEAIFVYTSSAPGVADGDAVLVTGTVKEYRSGGTSGLSNLTLTELDNPGRSVTVESSGNSLPAPVVIGTGGRVPPNVVIEDDATGDVETSGVFDPSSDAIDFYESLEGMLVQVNDAVAVGPGASFGEVPVVGDNGDNAAMRTARGGLLARSGDFNPERVILDDEVLLFAGKAMPKANVGDHFPGAVVGVMDYGFGNFKLEVKNVPALVPGGLQQETASAAPPYQLAVATFNVENLAPGDLPSKYSTLAGLIVNNLQAPDLLAIEEIQDNSGNINNGVVSASQTWSLLVSAIQAAGGPAYEYRQIDPLNNQDGGATGGNIRVGFLFRTDRGLAFVDRPGGNATTATAVAGAGSALQLTLSPGRIDPTNVAFLDSRKPLAGEFTFKGERVFVVANHFNSKGGDDALFGRFQPPVFSSEVQRMQQAQVVKDFVLSLTSADPQANVVVLGDLNDFQFSNPLIRLKSAGLGDLIETLPVPEQYTYVYEGNSEVLDHIMAGNSTLTRPFSYDVVHVNSEFANQASDHEPQVALLCVDKTAPSASVALDKTELWPANHQYVTVSAEVVAQDLADPNPVWRVESVTSSEPDDGLGDGDTANDIVIVDRTTFQLRAERSGTGEGRTYTITYRTTDGCGNSALSTATVFVPRDRGNGK